jgi:EAL domain-containing protein (putative c-di-GMP-specific phosphodiesterase class I)/CHASE2 domain-containing sensor protein
VSTKNQTQSEAKPWKLLLWTAVAGLVFGLIGFGEIAEDWLRVARNKLHTHSASGDIVFVQIDDKTLREVGRWPWPRRDMAKLTDKLTEAGAKRIFYDITFYDRTNPVDDAILADALKRSGRVHLAVRTRFGPNGGPTASGSTPTEFAQHATLGNISAKYNYQNALWHLPYAVQEGQRTFVTFAVQLANRSGAPGASFMPDYSIDPKSIPVAKAEDFLSGKYRPDAFAGKDLFVGWNTETLGDQLFIPGTGKTAGAYVHIIGGETLKAGTPIYLGWVPLFVLTLALSAFALARRSPKVRIATLGTGAIFLLFVPAALEARLITFDITPALFVLIVIGTALAWRRYRAQGLVNTVTNLPNLNALRLNREGGQRPLVAARVLNYEEIVASLPTDAERQLVDQIVARLNVGSPQRVLYQGDGGIFAWFDETREPFGNQLEALHAMFRTPARIADRSIDLSIAFGAEIGSGRSLANRLASALVAADEAAHQGLKWKYHDPETLQDASWKLSILSQLDEAIDRGEVWVAFQPKVDVATRQVIGAEALARWTHPEKGPIAASEFVAAAEQHDRIAKLTDFVLEKAVAAAAQINKRGADFHVAVNLSARLLADKGLTLRLAAMLARHGLAPHLLTLELTETAPLTDSGGGLEMMGRLRELGVSIAIDDYGTGQSTLEYLKKIPAAEIKIDQSFVKGIVENRSDRLMVQSTISLAHSLGRKVVAEGVEQREILDVLTELGCDVAQGFAIGRPMSFDSLVKRVGSGRRRSAA